MIEEVSELGAAEIFTPGVHLLVRKSLQSHSQEQLVLLMSEAPSDYHYLLLGVDYCRGVNKIRTTERSSVILPEISAFAILQWA